MDEIEFKQMHEAAFAEAQKIGDQAINLAIRYLLSLVDDLNDRLIELQGEEDDEDE